MKLSFATLSCPTWTLEQIIEAGVQHGYDGIEFRGLLHEIDLANTAEFSPAGIGATRGKLEQAGLAAACLSSSVHVVNSVKTEVDRRADIAHAKRYVDMAKEVGAPYVRIFCGEAPAEMPRSVALDKAADSLREIGDFAAERAVIVVVETHDAFVRSELLMEVIRLANHSAVQVLWDIHHPYRIAGESMAHTLRYLDGHVRHTHVKDSVLHPDTEGYTYVLLGDGDIPYREALGGLKGLGYDGYLSLEWEKRWIPALAEPEVVIPHYAATMRGWLAEM
ncbi:MAG TPA: sugar phosphate isomerase/epimerase family protein [Armatimonadota bacterium]|jgi:sugar phosphate isomerase/epimerase